MGRLWTKAARAALLGSLAVVAALVLGAGSATAAQSATVLTVSTIPTTNLFVVVVGIPKSIVDQSFSGKKAWEIDVTLTYMDVNNTIQTVDSGVVPVASLGLVGPDGGNTDALQMEIPFTSPPRKQPHLYDKRHSHQALDGARGFAAAVAGPA